MGNTLIRTARRRLVKKNAHRWGVRGGNSCHGQRIVPQPGAPGSPRLRPLPQRASSGWGRWRWTGRMPKNRSMKHSIVLGASGCAGPLVGIQLGGESFFGFGTNPYCSRICMISDPIIHLPLKSRLAQISILLSLVRPCRSVFPPWLTLAIGPALKPRHPGRILAGNQSFHVIASNRGRGV